MIHRSCILNVRKGDKVELYLPSNVAGEGYRPAFGVGVYEKFEVAGFYDLQNATDVPILGIADKPNRLLQSFYYPVDVLKYPQNFPFRYCIPVHNHFLDYAVVKIYKKKFLDAKKLAEDKYLAEYDV